MLSAPQSYSTLRHSSIACASDVHCIAPELHISVSVGPKRPHPKSGSLRGESKQSGHELTMWAPWPHLTSTHSSIVWACGAQCIVPELHICMSVGPMRPILILSRLRTTALMSRGENRKPRSCQRPHQNSGSLRGESKPMWKAAHNVGAAAPSDFNALQHCVCMRRAIL